jgi:hypothetical protein
MYKPLLLPVRHPSLFWTLGLIVSIYYGWRGLRIQLKQKTQSWGKIDAIWVHGLQDSIFHFVSAMAGLAALYIECKIFLALPTMASIGLGTAVTLAFLSLLAVVGISGMLPSLLIKGKR